MILTDLAPPTNSIRSKVPTGFQVVRVDPGSREVVPFATNPSILSASYLGIQGRGLECPYDVKFGPDGAIYVRY